MQVNNPRRNLDMTDENKLVLVVDDDPDLVEAVIHEAGE
jgi:hypothetical protein